MMQAIIARTAMTARTATRVARPGDQPRVRVALVISALPECPRPGCRLAPTVARGRFWCTVSGCRVGGRLKRDVTRGAAAPVTFRTMLPARERGWFVNQARYARLRRRVK